MDYLYEESTVFIILFFVAFFASLIDSIAGGGGLLTTPSMLLLGISPLNVLATNKFQILFLVHLLQHITITKTDYSLKREEYFILFYLFVGSSVGTLLVSRISNENIGICDT